MTPNEYLKANFNLIASKHKLSAIQVQSTFFNWLYFYYLDMEYKDFLSFTDNKKLSYNTSLGEKITIEGFIPHLNSLAYMLDHDVHYTTRAVANVTVEKGVEEEKGVPTSTQFKITETDHRLEISKTLTVQLTSRGYAVSNPVPIEQVSSNCLALKDTILNLSDRAADTVTGFLLDYLKENPTGKKKLNSTVYNFEIHSRHLAICSVIESDSEFGENNLDTLVEYLCSRKRQYLCSQQLGTYEEWKRNRAIENGYIDGEIPTPYVKLIERFNEVVLSLLALR